jgi:hypothetical protein
VLLELRVKMPSDCTHPFVCGPAAFSIFDKTSRSDVFDPACAENVPEDIPSIDISIKIVMNEIIDKLRMLHVTNVECFDVLKVIKHSMIRESTTNPSTPSTPSRFRLQRCTIDSCHKLQIFQSDLRVLGKGCLQGKKVAWPYSQYLHSGVTRKEMANVAFMFCIFRTSMRTLIMKKHKPVCKLLPVKTSTKDFP